MNFRSINLKKFFLFTLLFIFALPFFVNAEIKHPYVLDEKPRVTFGDSVPVSTYYGLENYVQDYIGGFAHFTFTYTHHQCCFTTNPAVLYIPDVDPRTTNTPVEKWAYPPYHFPAFGGIPTDWYTYEIQFDPTGYTTVVRQQGIFQLFNAHSDPIDGFLPETDWVSLANRHPDYAVGNTESMAFTPVPIKEPTILPPPPPPENEDPNPVIIIPGIMGSAYKNGELVIDPILHTYDDLLATLDQNGYTPEVDLFTFPYEWRDSNILNADLLKNKISEVITNCLATAPAHVNCQQVDLIAHSMGGLVARAYIQSVDYADNVDQLIFLGTPPKGSPTDYLNWEAGKFSPNINAVDILTESFFEAEALRNGHLTIFDYIHDRPLSSVQELLPTFDYLRDDNTGVLRTYPNNYPQNVFLENLNNNISNLLNSGIDITNIVGNSGEDKTIKTIRVIPTDHARFWQHGEPEGFGAILGDSGLERGAGDNTVTLDGATLHNSIPNENSDASHRRIPTVEENRVYKILTGDDSITNIDNGFNLSPKVLLLQLLSPIDFVVTDKNGNKMGKNFQTGEEYNDIPNAFYSGYETDNEYITILNPIDGEYKIELQGIGSGGEYGVLTSYISDEFATTTETTGITTPNQITNLDVVVDNTNPEDLETEREVTIDVLISDINGAYSLGWITDKKVRDGLIAEAKVIIKFEKKKNGKYEKKVDKILIKLIEKELDLLKKKGKINQQAYDLLKIDLEYLINNN